MIVCAYVINGSSLPRLIGLWTLWLGRKHWNAVKFIVTMNCNVYIIAPVELISNYES